MAEEKKEVLSGAELVNPYDSGAPKGKQVEQMFDAIAPAYDFMNKAMTFGLCSWWRNRALDAATRRLRGVPRKVLDIATGTGDVAFELHRRWRSARVTGLDLSEGMLEVARRKLAAMDDSARNLISFEQGDSLALPYADDSFDLITVAYGVRNFEHLDRGMEEMRRVLRPGGVLCVIELSCPRGGITRMGYNIYTRTLIPWSGRLVSGDRRAYTYLPESIAAAPQRDDMTSVMTSAGLRDARWHSLTMGVVTYYIATK